KDLHNCAKSISHTKTRRIATSHSKSTIAHSLRMVSLVATKHAHADQRRFPLHQSLF
ncbi:hypothetical protein SCLCIDRAFT_1213423, partial [Scleroderma citrinum Foug A]